MSNLQGKILVVNDHGPSHFKPFEFLGLQYCQDNQVLYDDPDSIALVVLTGGSDVCPGVYGRSSHPSTYCNIERDIIETKIVTTATAEGIPLAGICRGAQLLCVMAGGILVQDITGHSHTKHLLTARYPDGALREIMVNGDHHQMQYPFDILPICDYDVLAWTTEPRSEHYAFDETSIIQKGKAKEWLLMEPDVVWYSGIQALAAQFHPEWMSNDSEGVKYFQELVEHYLVPIMEARSSDKTGTKASSAAG